MSASTGFDPYAGLSWPTQVLFWVVLAITISSLVSTVVLRTNVARLHRRAPPPGRESDYLWVFLVPALNEEVTIADSVQRLRQVHATHRLILVIDDGSQDRTAQILAGLRGPDLEVLSRQPPEARQGKAAALNAAWRHLHSHVLDGPLGRDFDPDRVLVVIVDADGRLSPDAPIHAVAHFTDPLMAGVQCTVRIYNRRAWLAWAQDVEFSIFGALFQSGRTWWGAANMGGNGQVNRLAALDAAADGAEGPWRHRLTEDQDIGVRLLQAGWHGAHDSSAFVEQQGLSNLRRLYRQRTRWAQGSWQAVRLLPGTPRAPLSLSARIDMAYYLLTPVLQMITGLGLLVAILLAVVEQLPFWSAAWPVIVFFLTLSFGPALVSLTSRGRGLRGALVGLVTVLPYTLYSWLIFPVLLRALGRQLIGRSGWTKTPREPIPSEG